MQTERLLFASVLAAGSVVESASAANQFEIYAISSKTGAVSGGDGALVQVDASRNPSWTAYLDNPNVTVSFHRYARTGLATGPVEWAVDRKEVV